jgi:hypothetical protein
MVAARDCNGLEPRVHAERLQDVTDMIPDRLDAQVQLASDLRGRASLLEQTQDLALSRCQMWMWSGRRLILDIFELAEDPDRVTATREWNSAELDRDAVAVGGQENTAIVGSFSRAGEIPDEDLVAAASLLRGEHGRHVTPTDVAHDAFRGRVDPADDSGAIDDVGRDADAPERLLYVDAEVLQARHAASVRVCGFGRQRTLRFSSRKRVCDGPCVQ